MDLICHEEEGVVADELMYNHIPDMLESLLKREDAHRPDSDYVTKTQRDGVNASTRSRVVAWISEVAGELRFAIDTIELALNYLDRFLSTTSITKRELQLVGLVALLVASKFHEPDSLLAAEASEMAQAAGFSASAIHDMETRMLAALQWQLHVVLPIHFVDCFVSDLELPSLESSCHTLLSAAHLSMAMVAFHPSQVAAAVVLVSAQLNGLSPSLVSSYLETVGIEAPRACQRLLLHNLPLKRERSPSPTGVEELFETPVEFVATPSVAAVCPVAKRPKLM
ncbi:hypothetical protein AeNC1_013757 [Aphanomyces euteiches]|nr:hypothetical protein AeNC1_013757 [Aphanomyces euteiches]